MKREITLKQKSFVDEYLKTHKENETFVFPEAFPREDFNVIKSILLKEHNISLETKQQDVYFIKCKDTGRIKIGISRNVWERFSQLQTASSTELELVFVVEWGGRGLEQHLHRKFANCHIRGEWFQPDTELLSMIEDFKKIQHAHNQTA